MSKQFTVPIILPADPATAMEAATKQYVDGKVSGGPEAEVVISATDPIATAPLTELWVDTSIPGTSETEVYVGPTDPIVAAPLTELWVDTSISGPTGLGHVITDEGTTRTQRSALNFVGAGVAATDDSANNRTTVTVPGVLAPLYHYIDNTTFESGAFTTTTWINFWNVNVTVVAGNLYEFGWQIQALHKTGTTPVLAAAGVRVVYDGPNESAVQVNAAEINLAAPNVLAPVDLRGFWQAPTSGTANILWQANRTWWSSVNVYVAHSPGMPRIFYVHDLGAI